MQCKRSSWSVQNVKIVKKSLINLNFVNLEIFFLFAIFVINDIQPVIKYMLKKALCGNKTREMVIRIITFEP